MATNQQGYASVDQYQTPKPPGTQLPATSQVQPNGYNTVGGSGYTDYSQGGYTGYPGSTAGGGAQATQAPAAPAAQPSPAPPPIDPLAFDPTPTNPNPGYTPPGGYGTNNAPAQANGYPAAPTGFFDAYDKMVRDAAAATAGGQVPNAGKGYADFSDTSTGTARPVSDAEGQASLLKQLQEDAKAQLPTREMGAVFKDTIDPGTTYGDDFMAGMGGTQQDWIDEYVRKAQLPNGGANPNAVTTDGPVVGKPVDNLGSGGSGWIGDDGQLHFPDPADENYRVGGKDYDNLDDATKAQGGADGGIWNPGGSDGGGYPGGGNTPAPDASDELGPNMDEVDPDSDLRNFQITPGAMLDRFKLAQQQYGTFADSTDPQYQAALRDANRAAAATGRLGSGMLRTSYGDLANTRMGALANERDTLFQNALLGSVNDAQSQFDNLMREQQYQTGAQDQAFRQAVTAQELQEALTSGDFNRNLARMIQGNSGNPADIGMQLANMFGGQSSAAGQSMATMLQGLAASGDQDQFKKLLEFMAAGGGGMNKPATGGTVAGGGAPATGLPPTNTFPTPARPNPNLPVY